MIRTKILSIYDVEYMTSIYDVHIYNIYRRQYKDVNIRTSIYIDDIIYRRHIYRPIYRRQYIDVNIDDIYRRHNRPINRRQCIIDDKVILIFQLKIVIYSNTVLKELFTFLND
jgi:hypothetical protein